MQEKPEQEPQDYRTYSKSRWVRLSAESYSVIGAAYFATVCCDNRLACFQNSATSRTCLQTWVEVAENKGYCIWAICLMPDHLHALATLENGTVALGQNGGSSKIADLEAFATGCIALAAKVL